MLAEKGIPEAVIPLDRMGDSSNFPPPPPSGYSGSLNLPQMRQESGDRMGRIDELIKMVMMLTQGKDKQKPQFPFRDMPDGPSPYRTA
jgi:hypothetical protein